MARPKKGEPGHEAATLRWHQTMLKKYDGDKEAMADFFRNIGRKGGIRGHSGGFASEKVGKDGLTGYERARLAGQKGGHISKRGSAKKDDDGRDKTTA